MPTLRSIAPEFAVEVADALRAEGHQISANAVANAIPQRCGVDVKHESAYVCTSLPQPCPDVVRPAGRVAKTVFFLRSRGFNVDLSANGSIMGIEIVGRPLVIAALTAACANERSA